jgi:acyl-CoA synthetase (NDP forming)
MKHFFDPETVALIGATENPFRAGYQLFLNLNFCFGENFYPVNPKGGTLEGKTCYPSILDVPVPVDVAVIFINASRVPEVLEQCGEKGIKRVRLLRGRFRRTGTS